MSAIPRPLRVVVASQDVRLLHEVSWMLEAVGYKVETTNDLAEDAPWRRYAIADLEIIDGRGVAEPAAVMDSGESTSPRYRIFLYDPDQRADFGAWYAAGAHDALRTPVSRGELLARVRTGARYLEFERRMQVQSLRSHVPGLYSQRGLVRKLKKLAESNNPFAPQYCLLLTEIDWFAGIREKRGEVVSGNLVNSVARSMKRAVKDSSVLAYLGNGRFAVLLANHTPAAGKTIAESLAKDFSGRESHHESIPRPTLSSAVVPWLASSNVEAAFNEALEILQLARHSGGDCVVLDGEFNQEYANWQQEMTTGSPFANVTAQDIMESFPAVLIQDASDGELVDALRTSGVPIRPHVDGEGRLVGIAGPDGESLDEPHTISHDAEFPEIYEQFSTQGCAALVVVADERPIGYLTCESFLSMIDPIDAATFAHTDKSPDDLKYLVVPSTVEAAAAEPAAV